MMQRNTFTVRGERIDNRLEQDTTKTDLQYMRNNAKTNKRVHCNEKTSGFMQMTIASTSRDMIPIKQNKNLKL